MNSVSKDFFRCPNQLIDYWMPFLSKMEMRVLLFIIRKTVGFEKSRDRISLSQFEKATGSSRTNIINAINKLLDKGIILKFSEICSYSIESYYELVPNSRVKIKKSLGSDKLSPSDKKSLTTETLKHCNIECRYDEPLVQNKFSKIIKDKPNSKEYENRKLLESYDLGFDPVTLDVLSFEYTTETIKEAYTAFLSYINVFIPDSSPAFFRGLLKNGINPGYIYLKENTEIVGAFKEKHNIKSLEIKGRYIKDIYRFKKGISLEMEPAQLKAKLDKEYQDILLKDLPKDIPEEIEECAKPLDANAPLPEKIIYKDKLHHNHKPKSVKTCDLITSMTEKGYSPEEINKAILTLSNYTKPITSPYGLLEKIIKTNRNKQIYDYQTQRVDKKSRSKIKRTSNIQPSIPDDPNMGYRIVEYPSLTPSI